MWAEITNLWNHALRRAEVDGTVIALKVMVQNCLVILKGRQMKGLENNSCNLIAMQYTAK